VQAQSTKSCEGKDDATAIQVLTELAPNPIEDLEKACINCPTNHGFGIPAVDSGNHGV